MAFPLQASGLEESCPFIVGKYSRVRRSFTALRDSFVVDEVLLFDSSAWSGYDGITGYFFHQPGVEVLRVWDVYDDENLLLWSEFFEEVPAT